MPQHDLRLGQIGAGMEKCLGPLRKVLAGQLITEFLPTGCEAKLQRLLPTQVRINAAGDQVRRLIPGADPDALLSVLRSDNCQQRGVPIRGNCVPKQAFFPIDCLAQDLRFVHGESEQSTFSPRDEQNVHPRGTESLAHVRHFGKIAGNPALLADDATRLYQQNI
jgi:hypothetical protein